MEILIYLHGWGNSIDVPKGSFRGYMAVPELVLNEVYCN